MHAKLIIPVCLGVCLVSCGKSKTPARAESNATSSPSATAAPAIDACGLLTSAEIESVLGEPLKETKASGNAKGSFHVAQCYFALPTAAKSISLAITQKSGPGDSRDPKQIWDETFHHEDKTEAREEGEAKSKPQKIDGVGDESFWLGTAVGGALFALKANSFIRISVGGPGDAASRIEKSKALAAIVLKRL